MRQAAGTFEADYVFPYLEHGALEPMNATAVVRDDGFEVWAPTQAPEEALRVAAAITGMPVETGRLHPTQMGGGFGRRLHSDAIAQAVAVAKTMRGTPVKLVWSREETMRHGIYRQSAMVRMRAGFNANGRLAAWTHRISGQTKDDSHAMVNSTYGADSILFSIPNILVDWAAEPLGVPVGLMRGVGNSIDVFAIQSFLGELAHQAGSDAYRFQRALLDPATTPPEVPLLEFDQPLPSAERAGRLRAVLDEAAKRSNWDTPMPRGRGRGIAAHEYQGGFYAVVVEVTLDGHGSLKVDRVLVVADVGMLGNPRNAEAQVEGGVAFGLSSALYGRISFEDGMVQQGNFDTYELLRADAMPDVQIHWITDRQFWGDVSQGAVSVVPPALTNAIYDAWRAANPQAARLRSRPLAARDMMAVRKINLSINGEQHSAEVDEDTPLLWVLRDVFGLVGTKYGCGIGACGCCTVHIDGEAAFACLTPIGSLEGRNVRTIEGLSPDGTHPLQRAWIEEQVPQCGYCQSGQLMRAAALLAHNNAPTREEIIAEMHANLCRCGTYQRIVKAIERAGALIRGATIRPDESRSSG
nr:molybdopterin cofactor-binding domain-containing protein [Kaistia hirudinis]